MPTVHIKFSVAEQQQIAALARSHGVTVQDFIKQATRFAVENLQRSATNIPMEKRRGQTKAPT